MCYRALQILNETFNHIQDNQLRYICIKNALGKIKSSSEEDAKLYQQAQFKNEIKFWQEQREYYCKTVQHWQKTSPGSNHYLNHLRKKEIDATKKIQRLNLKIQETDAPNGTMTCDQVVKGLGHLNIHDSSPT